MYYNQKSDSIYPLYIYKIVCSRVRPWVKMFINEIIHSYIYIYIYRNYK
jgi:hypothetical protein